jgi:hypothetical protein
MRPAAMRRTPGTVLGLAAALGLVGGCGSPPPPPAPRTAVTDPCAERLHDLCGPLLLHRALRKKLPDRLEDLRKDAGPGEEIALVCPATGKAYIYEKDGISVPGIAGKVIVRDAVPHSGVRWAITVMGEGSASTLNTRVVGIVEAP